MYDTIIIGGGPCGLTAAIYLARASKKVLLVEKEVFGGQITKSHQVENYPGFKEISGLNLAKLMKEQVDSLGVESKYGFVKEIKKLENTFEVSVGSQVFESKTVVCATGTSPRKMNIPGEELFTGRGVSYCATCDGAFFKDKVVAVVGGGNTAVTDALYLANFCQKVYLIHRRDVLRAEPIQVELLKKKSNVEFLLNATVEEINGENTVESITLKQQEKTSQLHVDGIFIAIGSDPNTRLLDKLMPLNVNGYPTLNHQLETAISGLFVAGDVREKTVRQLVTATSDAAIAAHYINDYLEKY